MNSSSQHTVYTIGHSTHNMNDFITMLQSFEIKNLVDIRSMPGSRKYPQFDKENLGTFLAKNEINYIYIKDLGGRRKAGQNSINNRWKNVSFRGYADYMETEDFKRAIADLENIAVQDRTAYMCAEAV